MYTTGFSDAEWLMRKGRYMFVMYFLSVFEPAFHFVVGAVMESGCVERGW